MKSLDLMKGAPLNTINSQQNQRNNSKWRNKYWVYIIVANAELQSSELTICTLKWAHSLKITVRQSCELSPIVVLDNVWAFLKQAILCHLGRFQTFKLNAQGQKTQKIHIESTKYLVSLSISSILLLDFKITTSVMALPLYMVYIFQLQPNN